MRKLKRRNPTVKIFMPMSGPKSKFAPDLKSNLVRPRDKTSVMTIGSALRLFLRNKLRTSVDHFPRITKL